MPDTAVHVLDDDPTVRRSVSRLLQASGWPVTVHESVPGFLAASVSASAGCLLLDVRLGHASGLDLLEELEHDRSPLGVVLISGFGDVASTVRAMRHGAVDFLTKPFEAEDLLAAVSVAAERSRARAAEMEELSRAVERFERLTPREREVCLLVSQGLLNKQIAGELGMAEKTVKVHRGRVMSKLAVGSVAELVRLVDRVTGAST
jgi:FixJ family two-component response regulator